MENRPARGGIEASAKVAFQWENNRRFATLSKYAESQKGIGGPGPARSSLQRGVIRHGLVLSLFFLAWPVLSWAAYAVRLALAASGLIPNIPEIDFVVTIFDVFMASGFFYLCLVMLQKMALSAASLFTQKEENVTDDVLVRHVPDNLFLEILQDMASKSDSAWREYLTDCGLPYVAAGQLTEDDAHRIMIAISKAYAKGRTGRSKVMKGTYPSKWPTYRLKLNTRLLRW